MTARPLLALLLLSACQAPNSHAAATESRARVDEPAVEEPIEAAGSDRPTATTVAEGPALTRGTSRIPTALTGTWTVVRQTVSGEGVQAYGTDDPELVGRAMTVTATGARWTGSAPPLTGDCKDAYFDGETDPGLLTAPLASLSAKPTRTLSFLCMGEGSDWGVAGELFEPVLLADGRLALGWFDNLVLVLKRG